MARPKGGPKLGGRQKGTPNKMTKALKEMVLGALDRAGGEAYLLKQAQENPASFLTLLGKILPMSIEGQVNHSFVIMGEPEAPTIDAWTAQHQTIQ